MDTLLDTLLDAIEDKQSFTELSLMSFYNSDYISVDSAMVKRLTNEHPALIKLSLFYCTFTADDAMAVIRQLHSLTSFWFVMDRSEYSKLSSKLDDREWIGSFSTRTMEMLNHVVLSRRTQQQ